MMAFDEICEQTTRINNPMSKDQPMTNRTQKMLLALLVMLSFDVSVLHAEYRKDPILITSSTVIDRDLEFDQTAFVIKGSNITLDLGGHTIIFNNGNMSEVANMHFDDWTQGSPSHWLMRAGSVQQAQAIYFGNYDAVLTGGSTIQSTPVSLKAGKTYQAIAFVKGPSTGIVTLRILNASDLTMVLEKSLTGSVVSRGFASTGDTGSDLRYKPQNDMDVVLELSCTGSGNFIVGLVDIKPAFDYGITSYSYHNATYLPDLPAAWFSGTPSNIIVKNGKLIQGMGRGVRCAGIRYLGSNWTLQDVQITLNGINTDGILGAYPETSRIDSCSIVSTSLSVLNRMSGTAGIKLDKPKGAFDITNNIIDGVPEMGIQIYGCITDGGNSYRITGNTIKQRETVTEGYAIAISGIENFEISSNRIEPHQGRGILMDAASGCGTGSKGTLNGLVHDNQILNIYEVRNAEYDENSLEAVGIRIRNWGDASQNHKNLKIYRNQITGRTDTTGVHLVYGVNITVNAPEDTIEIFNNDITVRADGAGRSAAAIALQSTRVTGLNSVQIHDNILATNGALVRFGGNDGADAQGVVVTDNTFKAIADLQQVGKPFLYGYWTGTAKDNILARNIFTDPIHDPSTPTNFEFSGSGAKALVVGRHQLEVLVSTDISGGVPIAGAPVVLKDKSGNTLVQRLTDSSGKAAIYSPEIYYSGNPTPVGATPYADGEEFLLTVSPTGYEEKTATVVMNQNRQLRYPFESSSLSPPSNLKIAQ